MPKLSLYQLHIVIAELPSPVEREREGGGRPDDSVSQKTKRSTIQLSPGPAQRGADP